MSGSFSRAKRRRMVDLNDRVDLTIEADRRFFERHAHRKHRLRLASLAEVAMIEEVHGEEAGRLPEGQRWYCAVKSIDPSIGARLRVYLPNDAGLDTDLPEIDCEQVFGLYAPPDGHAAKAEGIVRGLIAKWRAER